MNEFFKKMTYEEFKNWCNKRACDGQWGANEAMTCIAIMKEIDGIKIKGFFKKRATKQVKELKWKNTYENL